MSTNSVAKKLKNDINDKLTADKVKYIGLSFKNKKNPRVLKNNIAANELPAENRYKKGGLNTSTNKIRFTIFLFFVKLIIIKPISNKVKNPSSICNTADAIFRFRLVIFETPINIIGQPKR